MQGRKGPRPTTLRNISHNLLQNETSLKTGILEKRLNAGWRLEYLLGYDVIAWLTQPAIDNLSPLAIQSDQNRPTGNSHSHAML